MAVPGSSPASSADTAAPTAWRAVLRALHSAQGTLVVVRWLALALLLALAVADPVPGWAGVPPWALVLAFAGYKLVVDLVRRHWGWYRFGRAIAVLDLAVAGGLYLLGGDYDGELYTLVFLVAVSAAATLPPREALLYMVAAAAVVTTVELTLRWSSPLTLVILDIGNRLLILGLVAFGAAVLVRRLTLERDAARQARNETERLAELDRLRGNFVAAVSHELQTPLTAIRAGLGLLEASAGDRLRGDEAHLLTTARRNVDRLGLQINDLLTLNELEADALRLEAAPLDLRAVVADAVGVAHPLVEQKGQVLQVEVGEPLPVTGDRRRLDQALLNFVVNAHRHTPTGTRITIAGRTTADGVLLQVTDDGPGIPAGDRERIFQRFARLGTAAEGSGLGLPIAKAIVERHGGRVWVESEPGRGTTFSVLLPQQP